MSERRPFPTPLVFEDERAKQAIAAVKASEGIDAFVLFLRLSHFSHWLGYVPPLIYCTDNINKTLREGMDRGLVNPNNFASAIWNDTFRGYKGLVNNLHASFIPLDEKAAKVVGSGNPARFIHGPSAVPFMVQADMLSETGAFEGRAIRRYVVFINHLTNPNVVPEYLLTQAQRFYSREELWNKRAARLSSAMVNGKEVRRIKVSVGRRVHESWVRATAAEKRDIEHPFQGGLPGLGKSSR